MLVSRWRWWLVGSLIAFFAFASACGDSTETDDDVTTLPPVSTAADEGSDDPIPIEGVDDATRDDIVETLRAAIEGLYAQPVHIETVLDEEGTPVVAEARIDKNAELADVTEERSPNPETVITTRRVVLEGRAFLKSTTGPEAEAALDYTEVSFERSGVDTLNEAFTALGRIGPSLDRIVLLLETLPFDARTSDVENGVEISVILSPFAIYDYYAETGIEAVGGNVPPLPTQFAFLLEDGVLGGIAAAGTHFHDGEALEVQASIVFEPIEPFSLEIPPLQD